MTIKDTFTRGWVSGALGGLVGGLFGFLPYYLGFSQMRLSDWLATLVFGHPQPFSFAEELYALIVSAGLAGITGILFALLLPVIKEDNIYFKGWIIFIIPWWIIYFSTALAKTEGTLNLSVMTTISDGINSTIIGLASVFIYRLLNIKRLSKT